MGAHLGYGGIVLPRQLQVFLRHVAEVWEGALKHARVGQVGFWPKHAAQHQ